MHPRLITKKEYRFEINGDKKKNYSIFLYRKYFEILDNEKDNEENAKKRVMVLFCTQSENINLVETIFYNEVQQSTHEREENNGKTEKKTEAETAEGNKEKHGQHTYPIAQENG